MAGIRRLKSTTGTPYGCIMVGYVSPIPSAAVGVQNIMVRFMATTTITPELGKAIVPTTLTTIHLTNDTTNVVTSAGATDLATGITLGNEIKADYNAHRVSTTFHVAADNTNIVSSADASNQTTLNTLLNEIKADINAHFLIAGVHHNGDYHNTVTAANASSLATSITLANALKTAYNAHRTAQCLTFTVYGISPGTYDIAAKSDRSCSSNPLITKTITAGPRVSVAFGPLAIGELNNDGAIASADTAIANANFGQTGGAEDAGWSGDWLVPEMTALGEWEAVSTARRRVY